MRNLTQFELAARERDLYMVRKPLGAMCVVAMLVLGAGLVGAGLFGWGVACILERLSWILG